MINGTLCSFAPTNATMSGTTTGDAYTPPKSSGLDSGVVALIIVGVVLGVLILGFLLMAIGHHLSQASEKGVLDSPRGPVEYPSGRPATPRRSADDEYASMSPAKQRELERLRASSPVAGPATLDVSDSDASSYAYSDAYSESASQSET